LIEKREEDLHQANLLAIREGKAPVFSKATEEDMESKLTNPQRAIVTTFVTFNRTQVIYIVLKTFNPDNQ